MDKKNLINKNIRKSRLISTALLLSNLSCIGVINARKDTIRGDTQVEQGSSALTVDMILRDIERKPVDFKNNKNKKNNEAIPSFYYKVNDISATFGQSTKPKAIESQDKDNSIDSEEITSGRSFLDQPSDSGAGILAPQANKSAIPSILTNANAKNVEFSIPSLLKKKKKKAEKEAIKVGKLAEYKANEAKKKKQDANSLTFSLAQNSTSLENVQSKKGTVRSSVNNEQDLNFDSSAEEQGNNGYYQQNSDSEMDSGLDFNSSEESESIAVSSNHAGAGFILPQTDLSSNNSEMSGASVKNVDPVDNLPNLIKKDNSAARGSVKGELNGAVLADQNASAESSNMSGLGNTIISNVKSVSLPSNINAQNSAVAAIPSPAVVGGVAPVKPMVGGAPVNNMVSGKPVNTMVGGTQVGGVLPPPPPPLPSSLKIPLNKTIVNKTVVNKAPIVGQARVEITDQALLSAKNVLKPTKVETRTKEGESVGFGIKRSDLRHSIENLKPVKVGENTLENNAKREAEEAKGTQKGARGVSNSDLLNKIAQMRKTDVNSVVGQISDATVDAAAVAAKIAAQQKAANAKPIDEAKARAPKAPSREMSKDDWVAVEKSAKTARSKLTMDDILNQGKNLKQVAKKAPEDAKAALEKARLESKGARGVSLQDILAQKLKMEQRQSQKAIDNTNGGAILNQGNDQISSGDKNALTNTVAKNLTNSAPKTEEAKETIENVSQQASIERPRTKISAADLLKQGQNLKQVSKQGENKTESKTLEQVESGNDKTQDQVSTGDIKVLTSTISNTLTDTAPKTEEVKVITNASQTSVNGANINTQGYDKAGAKNGGNILKDLDSNGESGGKIPPPPPLPVITSSAKLENQVKDISLAAQLKSKADLLKKTSVSSEAKNSINEDLDSMKRSKSIVDNIHQQTANHDMGDDKLAHPKTSMQDSKPLSNVSSKDTNSLNDQSKNEELRSAKPNIGKAIQNEETTRKNNEILAEAFASRRGKIAKQKKSSKVSSIGGDTDTAPKTGEVKVITNASQASVNKAGAENNSGNVKGGGQIPPPPPLPVFTSSANVENQIKGTSFAEQLKSQTEGLKPTVKNEPQKQEDKPLDAMQKSFEIMKKIINNTHQQTVNHDTDDDNWDDDEPVQPKTPMQDSKPFSNVSSQDTNSLNDQSKNIDNSSEKKLLPAKSLGGDIDNTNIGGNLNQGNDKTKDQISTGDKKVLTNTVAKNLTDSAPKTEPKTEEVKVITNASQTSVDGANSNTTEDDKVTLTNGPLSLNKKTDAKKQDSDKEEKEEEEEVDNNTATTTNDSTEETSTTNSNEKKAITNASQKEVNPANPGAKQQDKKAANAANKGDKAGTANNGGNSENKVTTVNSSDKPGKDSGGKNTSENKATLFNGPKAVIKQGVIQDASDKQSKEDGLVAGTIENSVVRGGNAILGENILNDRDSNADINTNAPSAPAISPALLASLKSIKENKAEETSLLGQLTTKQLKHIEINTEKKEDSMMTAMNGILNKMQSKMNVPEQTANHDTDDDGWDDEPVVQPKTSMPGSKPFSHVSSQNMNPLNDQLRNLNEPLRPNLAPKLPSSSSLGTEYLASKQKEEEKPRVSDFLRGSLENRNRAMAGGDTKHGDEELEEKPESPSLETPYGTSSPHSSKFNFLKKGDPGYFENDSFSRAE